MSGNGWNDRHSRGVKRIQQYHHEILRLTVLGVTPKRIAEHVGLSATTVDRILRSDLVKKRLEQLQVARTANTLSVTRRLVEMAPKALDVLEEALHDETSPIRDRVKVAQDLMDRSGNSKITRGRIEVEHGGKVKNLIQRVKENAASRAVDAEVVETEIPALPEAEHASS